MLLLLIMKKILISLVAPCALFLVHCGGEEFAGPEEDLGPYADRVPWSEYMATSSMNTVAGGAASSACTTAAIRGLSDQIVAEMNCLHPGLMGHLDHLNVSFTSGAALPYMQQVTLASIQAATASRTLAVNSTLRTLPQQWILKQWANTGRCGVQIAAAPGHSNHESGLAFDTPDYASWEGPMASHNFRWFGSSDLVHFDYAPGGVNAQGVLAFQRLWNHNNPHDAIAADGAYGPATESRVKQSPRTGWSGTQSCN